MSIIRNQVKGKVNARTIPIYYLLESLKGPRKQNTIAMANQNHRPARRGCIPCRITQINKTKQNKPPSPVDTAYLCRPSSSHTPARRISSWSPVQSRATAAAFFPCGSVNRLVSRMRRVFKSPPKGVRLIPFQMLSFFFVEPTMQSNRKRKTDLHARK